MKTLTALEVTLLLLATRIDFSLQQSTVCENVAVNVDPVYRLARPRISTIMMAIHSEVPLRDCTFILPDGELVDLSLGHNSTRTKKWNYFGLGLNKGDCGIDLHRTYPNLIYLHGVIECRFRLAGCEEWESRISKYRVTGYSGQALPKFEISPKTADLETGDSITITCNTNKSIEFCHFLLPGGRNLTFDQGLNSESTKEYRYHGAGLDSGDCGVTLTGVDERLNGYVTCKLGKKPHDNDGLWDIDAMKIRTADTACTALIAQGLSVSCYLATSTVDCTNPLPIGTLARLSCKPGYIFAGANINSSQIFCQHNAKWNQPIFECKPACGRRNTNDGIPLISGGVDSKINEFPWHVAVYENQDERPRFTCGGTLISYTVILSAAHCFYDDTNGRKKDANLYQVSAGKHRQQYHLRDPGDQKRDVLLVTLSTRYSGRLTGFASDIAILHVKRPFEVTAEVNFICVDWTNSLVGQQLVSNNMGTVAGWGFTEDGVTSETLKYVNLPFVRYRDCKNELTLDLQATLTHDKFCAGFKNKSTSVCPGDSGGGLVFRDPRSKTYYLQGIVSIAFTPASVDTDCYSQLYTGFTSLSQFIPWVRENM